MSKRTVLLVDDEVTVLLTLKAVLEISGFDVDTAASAREARSKIRSRTYAMVITDMRMESDQAGREVIVAARTASYHPAVALLTAFPMSEDDWQETGADKMLVKPMQTRALIQSIERLLTTHEAKLKQLEKGGVAAGLAAGFAAGVAAGKTLPPGISVTQPDAPLAKPAKASRKASSKDESTKTSTRKTAATKTAVRKSATAKIAAGKTAIKKTAVRKPARTAG